jgi:hypothetical protein
MGSITALGIKDSVLDLETQILYHLRGNHYPPVPAEMVAPCIEAIDAYYDEDFDRMIECLWLEIFRFYTVEKRKHLLVLLLSSTT